MQYKTSTSYTCYRSISQSFLNMSASVVGYSCISIRKFIFSQYENMRILVYGLFCSVSGWHTTPVARRFGLVLEHSPFTNATSQWVWFADSIPVLVDFLRVLRFPPPPKNRREFWVRGPYFWFLVVCVQRLHWLPRVFTYVCLCGYHTTAPREPVGW